MSTIKRRETELDILRFFATLSVIIIHICGGISKILPSKSFDSIVITSLFSMITWCIPIFVMISGGLFLNPEKEFRIKTIFTKYIKRFIIAFLFWSVIYQIYYYVSTVSAGGYTLNWKGIVYETITGPYHMWYIYMLAGIYLTIPVLRKITENKAITEYFIVAFLIFSILQNYGITLPFVGSVISVVMDKICLPIGLTYIGYFILGFYIKNYTISHKIEYSLYALGILMLVTNCLVLDIYAIKDIDGMWSVEYLMPNIIIESAALYTFFVKRVSKIKFSEKTVKVFSKLTEYGFGVYLVHALINELIGLTGWSAVTISPFVSVPLLTIIVYAISLLVTVLIRKIPFVGKNIT